MNSSRTLWRTAMADVIFFSLADVVAQTDLCSAIWSSLLLAAFIMKYLQGWSLPSADLDDGCGLSRGELAPLPGKLSLPETLERTDDASEPRSSLPELTAHKQLANNYRS